MCHVRNKRWFVILTQELQRQRLLPERVAEVVEKDVDFIGIDATLQQKMKVFLQDGHEFGF